MAADVPYLRPDIITGDVLSGAPVRSLSWIDISRAANYVLGGPGVLVPFNAPRVTMAASTEYEFEYYSQPRYQNLQRVLEIRVRGSGAFDVEFPIGATAVTRVTSGTLHSASRARIIEDLSSQSDADQQIGFAITPNATMTVEGVCIWEMPRAVLAADLNEYGTELPPVSVGQPILYSAVDGITNAFDNGVDAGRRLGLFGHSTPHRVASATSTAFAFSTGSSTYQDYFESGIPCLQRKDLRADTTGELRCRVLAWVTGGTADMRLSSSVHGTSSAVSISTTTPAWSSEATLDIDAEDLTASDGLRSSTFDEINVQVRKNTSGTVYVAAVGGY